MDEPLTISNPRLGESKLEPTEDANYIFDVTNNTTDIKLTGIKMTLQYSEELIKKVLVFSNHLLYLKI